MRISEFVVRASNPYCKLPDICKHVDQNFLEQAIEFAARNKVLPIFYERCLQLGMRLPKRAELLMRDLHRKRRAQLKAIEQLLEICEMNDIKFMFIKTFKPFNYIPDDIDLLLYRRSDLNILISLLRKEGYNILKLGTPEVVMRKIENGTYVDLDIHTSIAVGYLELFKSDNVWQNQVYMSIGEGYKVPVLSEDYEIVREAAYSLLKDFMISITGLYLAIHAMMKKNIDNIRRIANEENLLLHLDLFLGTSQLTAQELFVLRIESPWQLEKDLSKMLLKLISSDFYRKRDLPYLFPLPVIAIAYAAKVGTEIYLNKNLKALIQLIKQPSSKGIGHLLRYLSYSR